MSGQPFGTPSTNLPPPGWGASGFGGSFQTNTFASSPQTPFNTWGAQNMQHYDASGSFRQAREEDEDNVRKPPIVLMISLILLIFLLVGGGFAGYLYFKGNQAASPSGNSSTNKIFPTPTGTPLFSDAFRDNKTGWDLTSQDGQYSVKVGDGLMALESDNHKLLPEILPGKTFADFRLDVDSELTKGDPGNGYGLYIRSSSSQDSSLGLYYRFELYGDGSYAIFKGSLNSAGNTQSSKVRDYTANPAIAKIDQFNHITVIAKGPSLTFIVNGTTLYTYSDTSYKSGAIALFVSNLPPLPAGAGAVFEHLSIFPV